MGASSPQKGNLRPHQLALELASVLHAPARVLDFAAGSGRNGAYLQACGFEVESVGDAQAAAFQPPALAYDGVISTHGLLHGLPTDIHRMVHALAQSLHRDAPMYLTFASIRDARFGGGNALGPNTFATAEGDEAGVPHSFFDEAAVRAMLDGHFRIEQLDEHAAEHVDGSVHWFVRARRL